MLFYKNISAGLILQRAFLPGLLSVFFMTVFAPSNSSADGFKVISAEEVKKKIDKKEKIVIIDARPEVEYKDGHLPGAINIPPEKYTVIQQLLPKSKKKLLVFYCRGTR